MNPRAVAQQVVDALPESEVIKEASVAGPGFINLRLTDHWLAQDVLTRLGRADLGCNVPDTPRTLVIDYSSPNVAKRMHVGHLRSTIIGNAFHRMYRFLGWRVIGDNHIGDWGTQFGKLIVAWGLWRDEAAYAADAVGELQRLYQQFGGEAKEDPTLEDRARAETVKLQEGDPQNRALWQQFIVASMEEFDGVYKRLGVQFDVTHGESHYRDQLQPLVEELLTSGVATKDKGAVIITFTPEDGKGLHKQPMLIRKSDGAALYGTSDLCTIAFRTQEWQPDRMLYVTDLRQKLHFRQLFAAARKIGHQVEMVHLGFGMLRLAGGAVASTRSGQVLNLVDVLNTARDHARNVVDAKSAHLPEEERAEIAEAVGVGAILYTDLSQNPQTDITFDWEKMLSMEGNTAPYLMYAHARCCSIFRKAALDAFEPGGLRLDHPSERTLAMAISRTPEVIEVAATAYKPNLLAEHLYGLANAFAAFYRDCRVLGDTVTPEVTQSRLSLVAATAHALKAGMTLLGLTALERM